MTSFGFQLYSLHAVDESLPTVIERVGETGFDGVELAGLNEGTFAGFADDLESAGRELSGLDDEDGRAVVDALEREGFELDGVGEGDPTSVAEAFERVGRELAAADEVEPADVANALETSGLELAGAHVGLEELEADVDAVVETYGGLGCDDVAVPWLDPEHFESVAAVEAAGERLDAVAAELAEHDVTLHYHNHDQEFVELDGEPALSYLMAVTEDVEFQLDLGWIGAAGHDPLPYLDDHADRVSLVHLKDYDAETGEPVEVGDGDLDIEETVTSVRDHGFDWLIYEAEERPDSYETLEHAAEIVETYW